MNQITIAIFGCTADPFTIAHRAIVKEVIDKKLADKVIIAPTIVDWYRKDKVRWLTDQERLFVIREMMRLSGIEEGKVEIYSDDISHYHHLLDVNADVAEVFKSRTRFIDTLIRIRDKYSHQGSKFKFIVGADEFQMFAMWTDWESILKLASIIVVSRPKIDFSSNIPSELLKIPPQFADVSATKIRQQYLSDPKVVASGLAITNYLVDVCSSERQLLETPIFNVVERRIKDTKFKPIQVQAPDWVSILAKKGNEFVVVKQVRYGLMRPFMEFPCGMIEKGEFPAVAACREFEEETGIRLTNAQSDLVYLGKIPTNPAFMTNHMHYFFVDLDSADHTRTEQHLDPNEKIIVSRNEIDDLFYRAYNTENDPSLQTPALMCTALFLYDNYRKYPKFYKKGVELNGQV